MQGWRAAAAALMVAIVLGVPAADAAELRLPVAEGAVDRISVTARARGCERALMTVSVGGRLHKTVGFGRRWRRATIVFDPAPFAADVALAATRCRLKVRRVTAVPRTAPVALGTAVTLKHVADERYATTLSANFASVTTENELKMDQTQPRSGEYRFENADRLVGWAAARSLPVRGHALVFGTQTPRWVWHQRQFPDMVRKTLRDHITTLVRRYGDRVREWDVVNEAIGHEGDWRSNAFYAALGPEYVEESFRAARHADPTAKLFYNEIGADLANPKQDAMFAMVGDLKAKGLIDGVGFQMHVSIHEGPSYEQLRATLERFAALGLEVQITEMDVDADGLSAPEERLARQAQVYADAGRACRAVPACTRFTVWGVADHVSWLQPGKVPLLFDSSFAPKPALEALRLALQSPPGA